MKILSLNVNNFGGHKTKKSFTDNNKWKEWRFLDKTVEATEIFAYIQQESPVVTILHEFELKTKTSSDFIESMKYIGYEVVQYENTNLKDPSMTIMFVKKELIYKKITNPHKCLTGKTLRASVIKVADFIIYGVHIPSRYDGGFWQELIGFYKEYRRQKLVIIGDLNVYDIGTDHKKEYLKLLELDAKDAWLEKGFKNSTETHVKGRRLDYAIMSPSLYECLNDIRIDSYLMDNSKTDHAALIINI